MDLWFPEMKLDDVWTPVGPGYTTRDDAEIAIAKWKEYMRCYGDGYFRYRRHHLAEPPEVEATPW